jgi:hypothetical protein
MTAWEVGRPSGDLPRVVVEVQCLITGFAYPRWDTPGQLGKLTTDAGDLFCEPKDVRRPGNRLVQLVDGSGKIACGSHRSADRL